MDWGLPWPGPALATQAEAAGAQAFCAGEFADLNAYITATEMALGTSRANIGPGIAYAFARSPFVHAAAVRHLCALAPGRVFLHAENGERVRYEGRFYAIDADIRAPVLGRLDVPILIGAFNKIMLRTAGRAADGVLGHGLFTDRWWEEVVDPELARGADTAGRDLGSLHRWGWLITAIDDADPERAATEARLQIAFYLTVRTYDSLVELHGWQDQVAAIRAEFRNG